MSVGVQYTLWFAGMFAFLESAGAPSVNWVVGSVTRGVGGWGKKIARATTPRRALALWHSHDTAYSRLGALFGRVSCGGGEHGAGGVTLIAHF